MSERLCEELGTDWAREMMVTPQFCGLKNTTTLALLQVLPTPKSFLTPCTSGSLEVGSSSKPDWHERGQKREPRVPSHISQWGFWPLLCGLVLLHSLPSLPPVLGCDLEPALLHLVLSWVLGLFIDGKWAYNRPPVGGPIRKSLLVPWLAALRL